MMNPLEITYYYYTGYSPSDEPASESVIDMNDHTTSSIAIKEFDPARLQVIKVNLSDEELKKIDYIKVRDTVTGSRWYYFVTGHQRYNGSVVGLGVVIDNFASVGLGNISFYGNITRRSLSAAEKTSYPLLPEPWAPRRPLKVRRLILDLNTNKTVRIPSHISTTFEESTTTVADTRTINVPSSALGSATFSDSLSFSTQLSMGYPNVAADSSHTITTPWGNLTYTTPYETYYNISGTALSTFLEKAKKYNALDLIEAPYYLPNPTQSPTITISELSNANTKNLKASKFYTTITIRSLASGEAQTYSDNEMNMQYSQPLTVVVVPDKSGGIYLIPTTLRDTGLNAYTYLNGVYSPFETITYNAVGDTPAKYASDGTITLTTALNNLYMTYINKVNALQLEGMQANYFKEMGAVKGVVMSFIADQLELRSQTTTTTEAHYQNTTTTTNVPVTTQTTSQSQSMPSVTQLQTSSQSMPSITQTQSQNSVTNTHYVTTNSSTAIPSVNSSQNTTTTNPSYTQTQASHNYTTNSNSGTTTVPSITTNISAFNTTSRTTTTQSNYTSTTNSTTHNPPVVQYSNSNTTTPAHTVASTGNTTTPAHTINTSGSVTTGAYTQNTTQSTLIPAQTTVSTTVQNAASANAAVGNSAAVNGIPSVYEIDAWSTLRTMIFGGFRNEVHAFMLGNINDYLNRWVSIQNDMHNGKVANLFKNVTLIGGYSDRNKLAGKYEIIITSLQPEDELNFDLFLEHFGHSVDEYTDTLVTDVKEKYNYVMVGEDAVLSNTVKADANGIILNQFKTGVRVWKTLIRPENY